MLLSLLVGTGLALLLDRQFFGRGIARTLLITPFLVMPVVAGLLDALAIIGVAFAALLMFANVFLILCAYYFIKPLREGWIAVSDISGLTKMEVKAYSSFGQSLLFIPVVWFYGRLSDRWRRSDLITRATIFCISNLAVFWALQPGLFIENLPYTGIVFYLWVGMFGVFIDTLVGTLTRSLKANFSAF